MTAIDGERQPGTIPGLAPGALLDRIDELARLLHRSPMEVVILAFADYTPAIETKAMDTNRAAWREVVNDFVLWGINAKIAPPVDAGNMTPDSPGDGRGAGGVAATPAPVSHAAPAHVHLGGGPCVYGERCGQ